MTQDFDFYALVMVGLGRNSLNSLGRLSIKFTIYCRI